MSDTAARTHRATLADDELFVEARPDEERRELVDGVIEMTTDPAENHGQIVGNLFAAIKPPVDQRRCRAYAGSTCVQTSAARSEGMAAIPDGGDRRRGAVRPIRVSRPVPASAARPSRLC